MAVNHSQRAVGSTGERTRQRIIVAAQRLLTARGHLQFSMRNIAVAARMHLANVQYYFPRRDDLVRALLHDTGERYRDNYQRLLAQAGRDPRRRFRAVVAFNLGDIADPGTRRYFTQLWALLDRLDRGSGTLLDELYRVDLAQLSERIAELVPHLAASELRMRATLLAALIEGAMLVRGAYSPSRPGQRRLATRLARECLAIATGA